MSLSRREVLLGTAAVAAIAPNVSLGAVQPKAATRYDLMDVIVIGAGLSGLGTAKLLEDQGLKVLVLEGRERVGGKVYTMNLPGNPEAGANTMTPGYGRTIEAARASGVELVDMLPRLMLSGKQELVLGGKIIRRADWPTSPLNPFPDGMKTTMPWEYVNPLIAKNNRLKSYSDWIAPESKSLDISLHDRLRELGATDEMINLAYNTITYYGTSAYDVSALMLEFIDGWIKVQAQAGNAQLIAKGGNQRIPEAMATKLKSDILLGKEVSGIDDDGKIVTVTCADDTTYRAKRVVCALPFSTLRNIRVTPGFTGVQGEAIKMLRFQLMTLVFLIAKQPFWLEDGMAPGLWTDGPAQWLTSQHMGATPEEVSGFTVNARGYGAAYLDRLGQDAAGKCVVAEIEKIRPSAKGKLKVVGFHSWGQDRFSAGDWAVYGPGQPTGLVADMALPHGNLFFCGEHTATGNRGMEGALESSERVAIDILKFI